MNTIANRKMLKSRISASWPHDSSHYRFQRTHKGPAFEPESKQISLGEGIAWAAAVALLCALCFVALGLA